MTDEQIIEMLKELVEDIDYDIYKDMFVHEYISPNSLIEIAKKHMNIQ
jgi:hypothetical protein